MSFGKNFPQLDKFCDAVFIKKNTGLTKKDFSELVMNDEDIMIYLQSQEESIMNYRDKVKETIGSYLQNLPKDTWQRQKALVKERKRQAEQEQKEQEKRAIIEEYLRGEEKKRLAEQAREQLPKKNLAKREPGQVAGTATGIEKTLESNKNIESEKTLESDKTLESEKTLDRLPEPTHENKSPSQSKASSPVQNSDSDSDAEANELDLASFARILEDATEQNCVVFRVGDEEMQVDSMMVENDRVIVQLKSRAIGGKKLSKIRFSTVKK